MGKLPNFEKAVIPIEKLEEYVLNLIIRTVSTKHVSSKGALALRDVTRSRLARSFEGGSKERPRSSQKAQNGGTVGRLCTRSSGYKARPWLSRLVGYLKERN